MSSPESGGNEAIRPNPRYYYDIASGQLLVGATAYDHHIEAGGHPADIRDLAELLYSDEPITIRHNKPEYFASLDNSEILQTSLWLYGALTRYLADKKISNRQRVWNERIIARAGIMGLHPGSTQLTHKDRFGSISNYYSHLGDVSAAIKYPEVARDEAIDYVRQVHDELNRMPTKAELDERFKSTHNGLPYQVIVTRVPGGLTRIGKEFGYITNGHDYKAWGVECYLANNHVFPNQDIMEMFGKTKKGPWYRYIGERMDFPRYIHNIKREHDEAYRQITEEVSTGILPPEVTAGNPGDSTVVSRATRYRLISALIPRIDERSKRQIVGQDLTEKQFIGELQKHRKSITWDILDQAAKPMGIYQNMWRTDYVESLKIEDVIKRGLDLMRGTLSYEEAAQQEDAIAIMLDFIIANGRQKSNPLSRKLLRNAGLLPSNSQMQRLFVNDKYFNMIIAHRLATERQKVLDEQAAERRVIENYMQNYEIPEGLFISIVPKPGYSENDCNRQAASYLRAKYGSRENSDYNDQDVQLHTADRGRLTEAEINKRVAKFMIAKALLKDAAVGDILIVAGLSRSRTFEAEIKRMNQSLTPGDVELCAQGLGVTDTALGIREKHYDRLREIHRKYKRAQLNAAYARRRSRITANSS